MDMNELMKAILEKAQSSDFEQAEDDLEELSNFINEQKTQLRNQRKIQLATEIASLIEEYNQYDKDGLAILLSRYGETLMRGDIEEVYIHEHKDYPEIELVIKDENECGD